MHYKKNCDKKLIHAANTFTKPLILNARLEKKNLNKIKKLCPSI